jgi:hypothetical protein
VHRESNRHRKGVEEKEDVEVVPREFRECKSCRVPKYRARLRGSLKLACCEGFRGLERGLMRKRGKLDDRGFGGCAGGVL